MSNMAALQNGALLENEHVKELLALLKENRVSNQDFMNVIGYVGAMECQLDTAVNELSVMRRELLELRDQQSHPVRIALQKAIRALEGKIAEMRARLEAVKANIIGAARTPWPLSGKREPRHFTASLPSYISGRACRRYTTAWTKIFSLTSSL